VGWDTRHPDRNGHFLEEQEIVAYFPELVATLGQERPDFVVIKDNIPCIVIETKNDFNLIESAWDDAKYYADKISEVYVIRTIVAIAGTPDTSIQVRVGYKVDANWQQLVSNEYPLTQIPTPDEVSVALQNNNGTTDVRLPSEQEFYEAAIAISRLLRTAKIEEPVRPKIIGALILALYHGDFSYDPDSVLEHINSNVSAAVRATRDLPDDRKEFLINSLKLSTESIAISRYIRRLVLQLERLNIRSIMRSGVDFLGQFYEAFLRYGADSKALGIVFTPRHITRYAAEISNVELGMQVYDPACGTGGFLVAAFDRMMVNATTARAKRTAKGSLYGYDTNATVWALSLLNMIFRGDGKSNIVYDSCFHHSEENENRFNRVLLNPPFHQDDEPETAFVDHALNSLVAGGELVAVVPTGVLADNAHIRWRENLVTNHSVLATISMPVDLFYPTGAPTSLLVVAAHVPQHFTTTFMAKVHNDGYTISKNRRIPTEGSQLPEIAILLQNHRIHQFLNDIPGIACRVPREHLINGTELCAELWLPQQQMVLNEFRSYLNDILQQLCLGLVNYPIIIDGLIEDYAEQLATIGDDVERPTIRTTIGEVFEISQAKSIGKINYPDGIIPFVSSSDSFNSIVGLVNPPPEELYDSPVITVTGFGRACIQPWKFCARGNGGSSVRILTPKFSMTIPELLWYVSQINYQQWRHHYGRMAIQSRMNTLKIDPYLDSFEGELNLIQYLRQFSDQVSELMTLSHYHQ
jgi:hypothetical protein